MDGFMGEVKLFAGTYPPRCWAFCEGQLLSVSEHTALFSLLGIQFGGDGRTTFGLPDLRGRVPVGAGTGPGLTTRRAGDRSGDERVSLSEANLPPHQHPTKASNQDASLASPNNNSAPATIPRTKDLNIYSDNLDGELPPTGSVGGGQAHENMQPWECLHYIICLEGDYPPRKD